MLLHDGKIDPVEKLRNFEGPILTVGSEQRYELDEKKELVNRDGSKMAVIHQYDRHPELLRIFEKRAIPSVWRRCTSMAAFSVIRRMRSLLRVAKRRWNAAMR